MSKFEAKIIGFVVLVFLVVVLLTSTFTTVNAGERGVKVRLGKVVGVIQPGLNIKIPLMEHIQKISVRTQTAKFDNGQGKGDNTETSSLFAASKDLQDVQIATVVNYHVDAARVMDIYQQYSSLENFQQNVVEPTIRDTVKSVASEYTAEELVTKRADFNDKVTALLTGRLSVKFVVVEKVNITNFEFSAEFNKAIEAKVTASQNAEAARNKLEQVKFEAQQTIESAKAQAESIRIQAQAITQQGGREYVNLQAVKTWNGVLPVNLYGSAPIPFLNINN